jgi:hypothetical protein
MAMPYHCYFYADVDEYLNSIPEKKYLRRRIKYLLSRVYKEQNPTNSTRTNEKLEYQNRIIELRQG